MQEKYETIVETPREARNRKRREKRLQNRIENNIPLGRPRIYDSEEKAKQAIRNNSKKYYQKKKLKDLDNNLLNNSNKHEYLNSLFNKLKEEDFSYFVTLTYKPFDDDFYNIIRNNIRETDRKNQMLESEIPYASYSPSAKATYKAYKDTIDFIGQLSKMIEIVNYLFAVEKTKDGNCHIHLLIEPADESIELFSIKSDVIGIWRKGGIYAVSVNDTKHKRTLIRYVIKNCASMIDSKIDVFKNANHWMYELGRKKVVERKLPTFQESIELFESERKTNRVDAEREENNNKDESIGKVLSGFSKVVKRLFSRTYWMNRLRLSVINMSHGLFERGGKTQSPLSTHIGGGVSPP